MQRNVRDCANTARTAGAVPINKGQRLKQACGDFVGECDLSCMSVTAGLVNIVHIYFLL